MTQGQEVAVTVGTPAVVQVVNLDHHAALVKQEEFIRSTIASWKKQLDQVQAAIKSEMGDAEEAEFAGAPVFTWSYIDGMNTTEFKKKYPQLATAYTHLVEKEEIDVALLRTAQPDIYREFQTRQFKRVT